jgi:hypothetical protein
VCHVRSPAGKSGVTFALSGFTSGKKKLEVR